MTKLYVVRHGRAEAGFGESADPGLDGLGLSQAEAVAEKLKPLGPLPILCSPLARTRQTAAPLAKLWNTTPIIEDAVAEIPSPPGMSIQDRVHWLRKFMAGTWRAATPQLAMWREHCIATVAAIPQDSVIVSHYVALNVIAGVALKDERVTMFSPDNCSVTIFETDGTTLRLIEKGNEAALPKVN